MDYSFFVKQLGWMPKGMGKRGVTLAENHEMVEASPNFRYHEGVYSLHSSKAGVEVKAYALECAHLIKDIFPLSDYKEFDLTTLAPNTRLVEHTDMTGAANKGWVVNLGHKVHFVLQSVNGFSSHRRDLLLTPEDNRFSPGGIYAFNNYVPHSVTNPGAFPRIHLVLMYADHKWESKKRLYDKLEIKNPIF